jgi:hypothetical protein
MSMAKGFPGQFDRPCDLAKIYGGHFFTAPIPSLPSAGHLADLASLAPQARKVKMPTAKGFPGQSDRPCDLAEFYGGHFFTAPIPSSPSAGHLADLASLASEDRKVKIPIAKGFHGQFDRPCDLAKFYGGTFF